MKDSKILKFLDRLKPVFEKLGADYILMRRILQIKLIMDGRRVPTVFAGKNNDKSGDSGNKFFKSLWIYVLMGLILIPFVCMKSSYIYQMSLVFVIVIFFIMTSLISDFSSVLLDIKDKVIIGIRPVDPKTLRLSKTIHILIYMICLSGALTGPALLVSLFTQGLMFFLIFLFSIILLNIFIIVLTALVYFFVLRFFDGEKLKDIINYVQIILSVVLMLGYQLLGRLFNVVNLNVQFTPRWWQYFIIPVWFSAPFQMIKKSEINSRLVIFTVMAVVVPIISILIYIKLIPVFENNLQKLSNNYKENKRSKKTSIRLLAKILCRDKEERMFFRFAFDMMKNERDFKLKVYPTLAYSTFFPFIFIFQLLTIINMAEISQSKSYLFIYFCGMMLPTVIIMLRYSESYKGAWIYNALPIKNPAPVFKGTIKAFITKLFFPVFLFQSIIFTAVFGTRIVPDLLLIFLNMMLFNILSFLAIEKHLPFSEPFQSSQQGNVGITLILFMLLGLLAGIHYILTKVNYGIYVYLIISFIANLVLWKLSFNISPYKIKSK